jgi:hypothetical protein
MSVSEVVTSGVEVGEIDIAGLIGYFTMWDWSKIRLTSEAHKVLAVVTFSTVIELVVWLEELGRKATTPWVTFEECA